MIRRAHVSHLVLGFAVGTTGCGDPGSGAESDPSESILLELGACKRRAGSEPFAGRVFTGIESPPGADEDRCARAPRDLVYEVHQEGVGKDADSITFEEGALSPDEEDELTRPWLHVGRDARLVQVFWGGTDESGRSFRGRRVERIHGSPAVPDPLPRARNEITDDLGQALAQAAPDSLIGVVISVHSSRRQVPLPAVAGRPEDTDDLARHNAALEARAIAAAARDSGFESEVTPIVRAIEAAGGRVNGLIAAARTIDATLPSGQVAKIAALATVDQVSAVHQLTGAATIALGWDSDGSMQGALDNDHVGQVAFGYIGEVDGGDPIKVAVTEAWGLEDEACMFDDGTDLDTCDPAEKLKRRYKCTNACNNVNYSNADEEGGSDPGHGTKVTSILAGAYNAGQSNPNSGTEPVLDADWRELATGMVRMADVDYAQALDGTALTRAYGCLGGDTTQGPLCREVEVVNTSMGWIDGGRCLLTSSHPYEDALEHLWDDGVLPVVCAHNDRIGTQCRVRHPGTTPMAFTVGAVDGDSTLAYEDWPMADLSAFGGADGMFGSTQATGSISVIDLVAGGDMTYRTARQLGNDGGTIETTAGAAATSFSTPLVSGVAALVKEYRLDTGDTWINQAGFLEAHMLAMGDRYSSGNGPAGCAFGGYSVCGFDKGAGAGRVKLQAPTNWQWAASAATFTGTSSAHTSEFTMAIPSGSKMVKCMMTQREPMENKSNFSLVGLSVKIRDKVGGQCVVNSGSTNFNRVDAYFDTKHHVTVLASEVSIGNRCADVDLDPSILSSDGAVTTYTYCYTSPQLEQP